MKITIIGATGFVGSHVLREALARKHYVAAIVRDEAKIDLTSPHLAIRKGNVLDEENLLQLLMGSEVVVSAYNPGWDHPKLYQTFMEGSMIIQRTAIRAGVSRLFVIGGAGSLEITAGHQLVDGPDFPERWKAGAKAARDYLNELKTEKNINWVFLSPAIEMHPGTSGIRKGTYSIGTDRPVFDSEGHSKISVEDLATAVLDEIEDPKFHRQRFTVGWR